MNQSEILKKLTSGFDPSLLQEFLRCANPTFKPLYEDLSTYLENIADIDNLTRLGLLEFSEDSRLLCVAAHMQKELSTRSGKKAQYILAKKIIDQERFDGGLFAFYDDGGRFRLSLIVAQYHGTKREFPNFRRYTFFVEPGLPNKTFFQQLRSASFTSLDAVLEAFSIEAVSNEFYRDFSPHFRDLVDSVCATDELQLREDFALLFVIRIIFIGFVQKKGWLGANQAFLSHFLEEYKQTTEEPDSFYHDWLEPLFFEALSHAPGYYAYSGAPFCSETIKVLQNSPFLNGELFKRMPGIDDIGLYLPNEPVFKFFEFLFQYNFTVEENRLYDEELELNPEFLGLIFERLVNKEYGAVYTPRTEVDLMCRLALVKWLEKNNRKSIAQTDLYNFLFRNIGADNLYDEYQKQGDFSAAQIRELICLLENISVCDPAAGSGAFEVGMLQVLADLLENLYERAQTPADLKAQCPSAYELKKSIIERSLYGVEVKRLAVWINQLRLWLSLFVDMPDDLKDSQQPLLPSLTFKVRVGDSLVQRIGQRAFPIQDATTFPQALKARLTKLKEMKRDFYYNRGISAEAITHEEVLFFQSVLDEQIESTRQEIKKLLQPQPNQASFLAPLEPRQLELSAQEQNLQRRRELERHIADLKEQKALLVQQRPFLWSLEFSEIFLEHGGFDIIIGNPPYMRKEAIVDPIKERNLTPMYYKQALREMLLLDFPDYFAKSKSIKHEFKPRRRPTGHSDLYTYFYIRALRLLNENGIHVFICSNSWLDVGYGAWLQEFLLRTTPIYFIIDNHAKRSFASSDVNTIITVLGAPHPKGADANHLVRFVAFKKPFEEAIFAENLLAIQSADKIEKQDAFRVYPATPSALLSAGSEREDGRREKYVGDKWGGKYLRAPDIYFTIMEKGRGKLVRLGDIAEIKFGIITGANNFFYLRPLGPGSRQELLRVRNGAGWEGELEEEFLKPVIKSPRECRTIIINPAELRYRIFMCHKSKEELKGTKALEYIEWGEHQEIRIRQGKNIGKTIIGYQNAISIHGRKYWWDLGKKNIGDYHFNYLIYDVGRTYSGKFYSSDNFFSINPKITNLNLLQMNNSIFYLIQNVLGRVSFGGGLMKIQTYELSKMHLPFSSVEGELCDENYVIQSIFEECGLDPKSNIPLSEQMPQPAYYRKRVDDVFFDELNLTIDERNDVYRTLCSLVYERLKKANSL